MATQYTSILKLALPVTGELSGTWGDVVNNNITSMVEQAIAGLSTINTWTANAHTLTVADGTTSESRCAMLVAANGSGGTALSAAGEIICPAASKLYVLKNGSSYAITLKTAAGTGVAVPAGDTAFLFCDGTNVNSCVTTIVNGHISGNLTVDGNTTLGDANTDTVTVNAQFNTDLLPSTDNARDLGSTAKSWRTLYCDTSVLVGNLSLSGNTISSTDTNGNIVIAPNGTGDVQLDADTVRVGDSAAAVTLTSNGAGALTVTTGGAADLVLNTNSGTNSGSITIGNGTNGNITVATNGTGDFYVDADTVRIGDSNANATLTTNGTGDLILNTNAGTNSGSITIEDGVNGNIIIAPNGTGQVQITNAALDLTTIEVSNINAKDGTAAITIADSTGAVGISTAVTMSATTQNIALGTSQTTGTFTVGGAAQTGTQTFDQSTKTHTLNLGTGATESGLTKTVNIGTGGVSTSTTAITIGSTNGTSTTLNGTVTAATLNSTTIDTTNLEVTNIKAKDGTAALSIADSTGAVTVATALTANGGAVFNENGADVDFRVESDTDTHCLFVDASANNVGIGTNSPGTKLAVNGTSAFGTGFASADTSNSRPTYVRSSDNNSLISFQSSSTSGDGFLVGMAGAEPRLQVSNNLPLVFLTNNTERMRLDSSGNLGLGVTPSAWVSGYSAMQIGPGATVNSTSDGRASITSNIFVGSGPAAKYIANGFGSAYTQLNGEHLWLTAPNNTSGANANASGISTIMTLDASGNLGLGITSPAAAGTSLHINGSTDASLRFTNSSSGTTVSDGFKLQINGSDAYLVNFENGFMSFYTNITERARITSAGDFELKGGRSIKLYNAANNATSEISSDATGLTQFSHTGVVRWLNATATGTLMTLDASGNLGVGATSPSTFGKLAVYGSGTAPVIANFLGSNSPGSGATYADIVFGARTDGTVTARIRALANDNGNGTDGQLSFWTADDTAGSGALTERARITSGGYFKASNDGTYYGSTFSYHELRTSATNDTAVISNTHASSPYGVFLTFTAASPDNNTNYFLKCDDSTATRCYIYSDGDLANHDGVYGTISDQKLKQDIVDAGSQWDDIKAIRFRKYRMKSDVAANPDSPALLGVIAQELEQVSPGLVDEHPDMETVEVTDEDGNVTQTQKPTGTTTKTVKSSILLIKAAVALQEAMARIEKLEAEVAALKGV